MSDNGAGLDLRIVRGKPSAAELGAVTAVIRGVLDELAAEQETRAVTSTTAWQRNQRPVRGPIAPGPGAWRSFSG